MKLNCVLMRGMNDDEIVDFARFGREHGVTVRFIEFMPLDASDEWSADGWSPAPRSSPPSTPCSRSSRSRPGASHRPSATGTSTARARSGSSPASPSRSAAACDRIRLTADGQLRNCLFAVDETDLRRILRGGGIDDDLAAAIMANVAGKWAGPFHQPGHTSSDPTAP